MSKKREARKSLCGFLSGSGSSPLRGSSCYHPWAYDSDLRSPMARGPHALPKRRLGEGHGSQWLPNLLLSFACPLAPNDIASLVGVPSPNRDPKQTLARRSAQAAVRPVPQPIGGQQWESWAQTAPPWAGNGSWEGWDPGAPQVTHPPADNSRAGVRKSSSAHRGDPGSTHVLPSNPNPVPRHEEPTLSLPSARLLQNWSGFIPAGS